MTAIYISIFILLASGSIALLDINIDTLKPAYNTIMKVFLPHGQSFKQKHKNIRRKKQGVFKRYSSEIKAALETTGDLNRYRGVCLISFLLSLAGLTVSLLLRNGFLIPILCPGFALIPVFYLRTVRGAYEKRISEELETTLSVITSAYVRSESFIEAIRDNLPYLSPIMASIFTYLINRVEYIDSSITSAVYDIREKINNTVWYEWCDAVCRCQDDKSLLPTLEPIVTRLSESGIVRKELEPYLYSPAKEIGIMICMTVMNLPLIYFMNKDWYLGFTGSVGGKVVIASGAAAVIWGISGIIKLYRPVEYIRNGEKIR